MTREASLKIAIGIATAGRRDVLADTVAFLANQTRRADEFLICPSKTEDINMARLEEYGGRVRLVTGPLGSSAQRNAIIEASTADIIIFFDDDFLPSPRFVAETERLFSDPAIVVATGDVLADGILTQGLSFEDAKTILAESGGGGADQVVDTYNAYGCNMIFDLRVLRKSGARFDEALPLYAWLEDLDLSRQLAPYGRIVKSHRLRGVHMGTKRSGRSPGRRIGYSQVANPLYLARKGTMSWPRALSQVSRNLIANTVRSFKPEAWVDRKGRLKGNLMAIGEFLAGRMSPSRIMDLQ